jgi:ATP-dependent metalloprotease FtsH
MSRSDAAWLAAAILFGGMVGPVLLMVGLVRTPAASASLLLNLEGVFTAAIAWFVFRENFDRRIALGMLAIVVGGLALSWEGGAQVGGIAGPLAVVGACLCWGIDNNLTQKVSHSDPLHAAMFKGLIAGVVNVGIASALRVRWPDIPIVGATLVLGFVSYGVSLVLFVLALRHLGTARTGAYFSLAPFVRDLFKQAQQQAPCIIFIDEIDAIGKSRDSHYGGGNDEREQTLNQLLSNMDGFDSSKGLVILGATNRPEVLDKALLRPGRFDRRIIVDKPDLKGRVDILKVHSKNVLMHDSVDLEAIARATSGAVGSDLANMINEAAILAVKKGRTVVTQDDLFESVEVVIAGKEKKDRILSKEEKKIVAYHEVGHALVTALEKHAEPVQKITIVPRTMGSLGYVMQVPEEEKYLMSKDEILTRIVTLYGGRAAEKAVFNSITTGASNDIEKATSLARAMVTQYGMSDKFGLMGLESVESRYLDGRPVLNCADNTAAEIDQEVMRILKECNEKAEALLADNRDVLDKIADYLFTKETITGEEFMKIYREVKGIPEDTLKPVAEQL